MEFSAAWARECQRHGLHVEALDRVERGVATPNEAKQIRFNKTISIANCADDIHTRCRGEEWTLEELLILRTSFIIAMERLLGSRTEAGDPIPDAEPTVRGRLLIEFEGNMPGIPRVVYA